MLKLRKLVKSTTLVSVTVFAFLALASCGSTETTTDNSSAQTSASIAGTTSAQQETQNNIYPENGLTRDDKVELKVAIEGTNNKENFQGILDEFVKDYPNVTLNPTFSPTISDMIKVKIAAKNDDDMFDILIGCTSDDYLRAGVMEPLDDVYMSYTLPDTDGKTIKDILLPGMSETLTKYPDTNGHYYGIPYAAYVGGMFFDQNFFDQNGWNKDPKTWDEFLKLCSDIKAKNVTPITNAGMYDYEAQVFMPKLFELAEMNGNTAFNENYQTYKMPYYLSSENLEKWKRITDLAKLGYIDSKSVSLNHTQSQIEVINHKAAMCPSGDWIENEMKDSTPADFKWGFMSVPFITNPDGVVYINSGLNGTAGIYANKPELSKKWSKWLVLYMDTLKAQSYIVAGGNQSVRTDFKDDPARLEKISNTQKSFLDYCKNHNVKFVDYYAHSIYMTSPNMAKAEKLYEDNVALMFAGKKDYLPILTEADKYLEKAIKDESTKK